MLEKVKTHVQENKKYYFIGATCLTVGVAAGAIFLGQKDVINIAVEGSNNDIIGKARTVNKTVIELVERSTPSKPVHLVGTNLYFNSISEAARETGLDRMAISKNIAGTIPDVKGQVFKLLELAE